MLRYYQDLGLVEVSSVTLPGSQPTLQFLAHKFLFESVSNRESIAQLLYNDCLYRNMYQYEYVAVIGNEKGREILLTFHFESDIDEVIMPTTLSNWNELMDDITRSDGVARGGWIFDDYYFISSPERKTSHLPQYLTMINSYYSLPEKQGITKYIANASDAYVIEHHWPRVTPK